MSYNVFISFKKQVNGIKTRDCEIAEELYQQLKSIPNVKPFFSEVELTDNSNFGEMINNALDTSVFFIYICTSAEYLFTPYVKHEWETFSNEIKSGRKSNKMYGVIENVNVADLPIELRKNTFYSVDEKDRLIAIINNHFNSKIVCDCNSIERVNLKHIHDLGVNIDTNYIRASLSDFIELVIEEQRPLSIIKFQHNCGYQDSLYSKMKELLESNIPFVYFNSVDEISSLLECTDFSKISDSYLFICKNIKDTYQLNYILKILEDYPNIYIILGVEHEYASLVNQITDDVKCFIFDNLSESEVQEYISQLSSELHLTVGSNLLTTLLLPALADFRTPKTLKIILSSIKSSYSAYNDTDYNLTDIFDILDRYIETELHLVDLVEDLIFIALDKGINFFLASDLRNPEQRNLLLKNGILRKKGNAFAFSSQEYYNNRIAEALFNKFGLKRTDDSFRIHKEAIPYYIYLYYQYTQTLILDSFHLDEVDIAKLLQLFISEEDAFLEILLSRKYDRAVISFLRMSQQKGLFAMAKKIISIYEAHNVAPSEELDYLSVKIMLHYYETGSLLETEETFGLVFYRKAYVYYCMDNSAKSAEFYELAIEKMMGEDFNYHMLFDYMEMLYDVGNNERINEFFALIDDMAVERDDAFYMRYYYIKALLYSDNLEFALSISCLQKCIKLCEKNINLKKLQIYYGELGEVLLFTEQINEAKKYIQINLNIAKSIGDFNGMAISAKMLAKCAFCAGDFEQAYKYISYAENFAQKANNLWRLAKIRMLLSILTRNTVPSGEIFPLVEIINSQVFNADFYLLASYSRAVAMDIEGARKYSDLAQACAKATNHKRLIQSNELWRRYLDGEVTLSAETMRIVDKKFDSEIVDYMSRIITSLERIKCEQPVFNQPLDLFLYQELETDRLTLRLVNMTDIADIFEYSSDPSCTQYVLWEKHKSINDTAIFLSNIYNEENSGYYMCWAISHKESGKIIGTIDLSYSAEYAGVEVGYIINKAYQKKGYGSEALSAILEYCKSVLKINEIFGVTFEVNNASRALLRSQGFQEIQTLENYHNKPFIRNKNGVMYSYKF